MKFYRRLQSWVNKKAEEEAHNEALRNPASPLTTAFFMNEMDSRDGQMVLRVEHGSIVVTQHINRVLEILRTAISDATVVIKDIIDDRLEDLRAVLSNDIRLSLNRYWEYIAAWIKAADNAAEKRHQEADDRAGRRQNAIVKHLLEHRRQTNDIYLVLSKQIEAADLNNSERFLALTEQMRELSMDNHKQHMTNFGTVIGLFNSIIDLMYNKQKVIVTEFKAEPTAEWMLERADDLIYLGDALKALRDNNAPLERATFEILRGFRSLIPCENSITTLNELIHTRALQWGVAEPQSLAA